MGKSKNSLRRDRKRWAMHGVIILLGITCLGYPNSKLITLIDFSDPLLATASILFFIFCINLFVYYGIYHLVVPLFSEWSKRNSGNPLLTKLTDGPAVALLYTTRNDFCERACLSCLKQDYSNYRLFILDDSTDEAVKAHIDSFYGQHRQRCTVIRRSNRRGFKAGNLNNALSHDVVDYPYFAVVDADEIIPVDFITSLLPYFKIDSRTAFVQASHSANPDQATKFSRELAGTVDVFWRRYLPARHRFGFFIFYGHGAIIRRDVWEKVGGFPEMVSEDLAFSCKIGELGYRGHYADTVVCLEDVPETYGQFKRRHNKWVQGAIEFLWKGLGSFLRSPQLTLLEKFDVCTSLTSLCLPLFFIPFLLVANIVMPFYFADQDKTYQFILPFTSGGFSLGPFSIWHPKFDVMRHAVFYLLALVGMFAPLTAVVLQFLPHKPIKFLNYTARSTVVFVSLMISSFAEALRVLVMRKAQFFVTGDQSKRGDRGMVVELAVSLILAMAAFLTLNPLLVVLSLFFFMGPLIGRLGWEDRWVRTLVFLPLFLLAGIVVVMAIPALTPYGALLAICTSSTYF